MKAFTYDRAADVPGALRSVHSEASAKFIAGGTNLVDLMKARVAAPSRLVDITRLRLRDIEATEGGGLRIGALATNSEVAYAPEVERRYPLLSRAILSGATPQLRNMATTGGNLLQRTRCYYFYDVAAPCNKRVPGSGCAAIGGQNRLHAILGASPHCIATHPSDMCVALAALEAVVLIDGPAGERRIPIADFHRLPGDAPERDTTLAHDELVTGIELPARGFAEHNAYLKLRDRASYAFALVSVAAALELSGGVVSEARIALGGVAHKPWRDPGAEQRLVGRRAEPASYREAADHLLRDARGYTHNAFKIELARRAIVRALEQAASSEGERT